MHPQQINFIIQIKNKKFLYFNHERPAAVLLRYEVAAWYIPWDLLLVVLVFFNTRYPARRGKIFFWDPVQNIGPRPSPPPPLEHPQIFFPSPENQERGKGSGGEGGGD